VRQNIFVIISSRHFLVKSLVSSTSLDPAPLRDRQSISCSLRDGWREGRGGEGRNVSKERRKWARER